MKPMKNLILSLLLMLIFNACSNQPAQVKKYYRLAITDVENTAAETKPMTVVIKRPMALSILGGRPMVATQTDGSLVQLSHNYWLDSPKVLLHDLLKSWATNHWQYVSSQVPREEQYQILETRILAFEKNQNLAKVNLEFFLYNADNRLLFNQQFMVSENIEGEGFKAFTQAITVALNNIMNQLDNELTDVN